MIRLTFAAATLALAPLAQAQNDPLSYSFWDVQYLNAQVEENGGTADEVEGVRAQLSIGLSRLLNFVGDWDQRRYPDARDAFVSAGLGMHTLHPDYQFFGAVTYERRDLDDALAPDADLSNEGYGVQVGARARLPDVELHASYKYLDLSDGGDTELTGGKYGGGIAVQLSPWWALVADYSVRQLEEEGVDGGATDETDYDEWSVGFRRYFATDTDRRKRKGGLLGRAFGDDPAE